MAFPNRALPLRFRVVSTLVLIAFIALASARAPAMEREIPKPSWWGNKDPDARPFLTRDEIQEQNRIQDGRLYYTSALLTAEKFPDNPGLVVQALYYAPFREGVSYEESVAVGEYFMEKYFDWEESAYVPGRDDGKPAGMVAGMVDRLVAGYCGARNAQAAFDLIDRFLGARGAEVAADQKADIFQALGQCIYFDAATTEVVKRLDTAYEELSPKVTSYNGKLYVYLIQQTLTRHRVEMGTISPCEELRNEIQREKGGVSETVVTAHLQKHADKQDWQKHLITAARFLPFESDQALVLADAIFTDSFYEGKVVNWQYNYGLPKVVVNMVCVRNERYSEILVHYFFGSNTSDKDKQIHTVLEALRLAPSGRDAAPLSINWHQNDERADVESGYSNLVFEKVVLHGLEYWLPTKLERDMIIE